MKADLPSRLTVAEFIPWELSQEAPHELLEGRVSALPGGTIEHSAVGVAILVALYAHLEGGECRVYHQSMTVTGDSSVRYPDVVVTCDPRDHVPKTIALRYPKLIVEVLSETTASEDLGPKLREYQALDSLEEYLAIDSRKRWAQLLRKTDHGWLLALPVAGGRLELTSVALTLDLDALYDRAAIRT